ncbi:MAG: hypothetical protein AAGA56_06310, partial [Myxococcota bacterium]
LIGRGLARIERAREGVRQSRLELAECALARSSSRTGGVDAAARWVRKAADDALAHALHAVASEARQRPEVVLHLLK